MQKIQIIKKYEKWSDQELNHLCYIYLKYYYHKASIKKFKKIYPILVINFNQKYNKKWIKNLHKSRSYLGEFSVFDPYFKRIWKKKKPSKRIEKIWNKNFLEWKHKNIII